MSEYLALTVIPDAEAIASSGSGNEGTKARKRGTGREGTKRAPKGAQANIRRQGLRLGGGKNNKALAAQIAAQSGNMTNKQVATYLNSLSAARKAVAKKAIAAHKKRLGPAPKFRTAKPKVAFKSTKKAGIKFTSA